jgi:5'-nucleotidase
VESGIFMNQKELKNRYQKFVKKSIYQKDIVYIDMDNVLVDFQSGINKLTPKLRNEYQERYDEVPNIFITMDPIEGAVEAFNFISKWYDVYILSTAPWNNPTAWSDKLQWIKKHLGGNKEDPAYKRLILTHHKNLNSGNYLIDDRIDKNGADDFEGSLIHFGSEEFPDWKTIIDYLGAMFIGPD